MVYNSLFDQLENFWPKGKFFHKYSKNQAYRGSLRHVLGELESCIGAERDGETLLKLIFHPPRIVRAVINYKIGSPERIGLRLVKESSDIAIGIYKSEDDAKEKLREFRKSLQSHVPEALDTELAQQIDGTSLSSMNPYRSRRTAGWMKEKTGSEPVFFVPLAHGAVAVGMDVYLRYCELTGKASEFYPVRFSRQKHGDRKPQITEEEKAYIGEQSRGKFLVIFEEDICSGMTMTSATLSFGENFPEARIFQAANTNYSDAYVE